MHKPRTIRKERSIKQIELLANLLKCFMDYINHTHESEKEMLEVAHGLLDPLFGGHVAEWKVRLIEEDSTWRAILIDNDGLQVREETGSSIADALGMLAHQLETVAEDVEDFDLSKISIVPTGFPQLRKDCVHSSIHRKKEE